MKKGRKQEIETENGKAKEARDRNRKWKNKGNKR